MYRHGNIRICLRYWRKRKKIFEDIYFSVEEVDGIGVVYTKNGDYSAILRMENPVQKYSANIDSYYEFTQLFTAICQTLGEAMPSTSKTCLHANSLRTRVLTSMSSCRKPTSAITKDVNTQTAVPI